MAIRSVIRGVSHFVPERVVTNDYLATKMATSDQWITERTGIKERRFVEPGVSASQLGVKAADSLLKKLNVDPKSIDLLIAATLSPDYYFPGIGVLMQRELGLAHIPALDIRAQCSGLVYGLSTVDAYIRSGQAKRVLLICAEVQSPVLDISDRGREMAVLFGDGAGAILIDAEVGETPTASNNVRGIIDSLLGSDGTGAEVLSLQYPGTSTHEFVSQALLDQDAYHPTMDGKVVFKHAVTRLCETAQTILIRNKVNPASLALVIPHQANLRINEMVREKLNLPEEKVFNNIQKYGNTTAATIPICMSEAVSEGKLRQGDLVLTLAFGAGFTWGANLICW
jgi:3-oxoacyl-[acyl-carrier-protein] synthase-3